MLDVEQYMRPFLSVLGLLHNQQIGLSNMH